MTRRFFGPASLIALSLVAVLLAHRAEAQTQPAAAPGANAVSPEAYRIGPEDMLQIAVWKNEALSRLVPVRPDGMVSLPLVHDVQAAGLTPMELRDILAKKLTEFMPSAEVSVIVTDVRSFKVSVIGEVSKPARYELKSAATVLDVLALAGGFNEFAARNKIVVLRPEGKTIKRIPFNYNRVVSAGGESENFYLRSGDIVLVP
jgi:polysaccharide export outer membrane protein